MSRSIMEDFTGIKKEWDRIRGEKKDGEDQIDRTNNPQPNTNKGDADYYDEYGCGYANNERIHIFENLQLDEQDNIIHRRLDDPRVTNVIQLPNRSSAKVLSFPRKRWYVHNPS